MQSPSEITRPGLHAVGGGLYVNVTKKGSRSWVHRLMIDGKRRDIGLGSLARVTEDQARAAVRANKVAVVEGRDPLAEKKAAQVEAAIPTFEQAARATWEMHRPRWRSQKHAKRWIKTMENHAFPHIGSIRVDRLDGPTVVRCVERIWTSNPDTAKLLLQFTVATLGWAKGRGFCQTNVAADIDKHTLPDQGRRKVHYKAMPADDVVIAFPVISAWKSAPVRLAVQFLILTATRKGEAIGARWSEIDLEKRIWIIPGERTKSGREHRVPISDGAMAILREARKLDRDNGFAFPSRLAPHGQIADTTINSMIAATPALKDRTTVHGFRSSFADWALENTATPYAVVMTAIAHKIGSQADQAYARSDLLDRRRELMQQWSDFLLGEEPAVEAA